MFGFRHHIIGPFELMGNSCYSLADNPLLFSKVGVTITVLDVNEFAPELVIPPETIVCEGAKVGQVSYCVHCAVFVCMLVCVCLKNVHTFHVYLPLLCLSNSIKSASP